MSMVGHSAICQVEGVQRLQLKFVLVWCQRQFFGIDDAVEVHGDNACCLGLTGPLIDLNWASDGLVGTFDGPVGTSDGPVGTSDGLGLEPLILMGLDWNL